jgi:site-specific recombinase XerD
VSHEIVKLEQRASLPATELAGVPRIIAEAGESLAHRFVEFFAATIRNHNTRIAYVHNVGQFMDWCERHNLSLGQIDSLVVASYVELISRSYAPPSVKQHLAAIRMCFDWLVSGGHIETNPAWSVRGPKHVVKKGKTPVLTAEQARDLIDSIDTSTVMGLRDRALIGLMVFSFARVGAVIKMNVEDYWPNGKRWFVRLHEKGGKFHELPCHHKAEEYLDAYLKAAGIAEDPKGPLFRTIHARSGNLTGRRATTNDVLRMIKRRAKAEEKLAKAEKRTPRFTTKICCHTFRATGITAYLQAGGTLELAQAIAAHESPRTTKLYDRTGEQIAVSEIERIAI